MQIKVISIKLIKDKDRLKGIATIKIDNCFFVHDIAILEKENNFLISMPRKKTLKGDFKDVAHPANTETRNMIEKEILQVYYKMIEREKSAILENDITNNNIDIDAEDQD